MKSHQGFGEETRSCCRWASPRRHLDLTQYVTSWTTPSCRVYKAQNKYYSVKWNWTGGVASEPNVEPTVGSTRVCETGILYGWAQLLREVWEHGNGVCWTYLKNAAVQWQIPGTSGCSRDQYHKQEFHLRTNNPHTPSDLNNFFADCRDKTKSFAHPCVDAVRNMWGYWWERALLHVSLVTKTSFHQSAKIQISVWILNQGSCRTADWYFRL